MKSTTMFLLPKVFFNNPKIEIIGMRSAEKVHEILEENGLSSDRAERFSVNELKEMYSRWLLES